MVSRNVAIVALLVLVVAMGVYFSQRLNANDKADAQARQEQERIASMAALAAATPPVVVYRRSGL